MKKEIVQSNLHTADARGAKRRAQGVSSVEMIIWIVLLGIVSAAIVSMTNYVYKRNRDVIAESAGSLSARRASERIVRDIREATFGQDGAYPIVSFAPNEIVFYSDADQDMSLERIRYYLTGDILNRGVINPTGNPPTYPIGNESITLMAERVVNSTVAVPLFTYYDASGVVITDYTKIGSVAYIVSRVVVNRAPAGQAMRTTEIRSSATMRNYLSL